MCVFCNFKSNLECFRIITSSELLAKAQTGGLDYQSDLDCFHITVNLAKIEKNGLDYQSNLHLNLIDRGIREGINDLIYTNYIANKMQIIKDNIDDLIVSMAILYEKLKDNPPETYDEVLKLTERLTFDRQLVSSISRDCDTINMVDHILEKLKSSFEKFNING